MTASTLAIGLPEIVAGLMILALNAYVLMGGADFGGGMWDLLARGPRRDAQRKLIADAIAPIWEANHVWLIVVVVMLFTAFPVAFAQLSVVLHLPITILLLGIVLRGSAFVFRSYGSRAATDRRRWGAAFAVGSVVASVMLGTVIGSVSSGAAGHTATSTTSFTAAYVAPWLAAYPLAVGGFALVLFAFLAAVYLTLRAEDDMVREDFRRRALASACAVAFFALLALILARESAPRVAVGVTGAPWAFALHLCTGIAAITAIVALWRRRYALARIAAAAQVSFILWGWAAAQFPYIVPDTLTIRQAAAPCVTLQLLLIGLAAGALILIPSLRYLFRTFGEER